MKKTILFLVLVWSQGLFAQTYELGFYADVLRNYNIFKRSSKGERVCVDSMVHDVTFEESPGGKLRPRDSYLLYTSVGSVNVKEKLEKVLRVNYLNSMFLKI